MLKGSFGSFLFFRGFLLRNLIPIFSHCIIFIQPSMNQEINYSDWTTSVFHKANYKQLLLKVLKIPDLFIEKLRIPLQRDWCGTNQDS